MFGTVVLIVLGVIALAGLLVWLYGERWRPIRLSSWRMLREGWPKLGNAVHAYVYGRWIKEYIYVLIRIIYPRVSQQRRKRLTDHYHAKVLTPELAQAIITVEQDIPLRDLEQVIPYPMARNLVLKGPPDVAVFQCGCRQIRENPCEPIEVCMVVGQPFVDFVVDHHPDSSRRLTQSEALEILEEVHERGHMHTAWFKDAALDRFYAICNCCKCCCGGVEAMTKYGVPSLTSSGYVAQVDDSVCAACSTCEEVCPFKAIEVDTVAAVDWDACMGCGVCVGQCPSEAMALVRDERKGIPMDVRMFVEA